MNVAKLLYLGVSVLRFTEESIMNMTLRKFYLLFDEHLIYHGKKKESASMLDAL